MFGQRLNRLQEPRKRRVASASHRRYVQWTALTVISLLVLFVGLDNMSLNVMSPLSDQLGAEGSTLRWIDRAEAIAAWTWTATMEIGLVAGDLVTQTPLNMPSSSTSASAAASSFRSW
jgi:hypothetical protein